MLNIHLIKRITQHCYSLQTRTLSTICITPQQQQRQEMMFTIILSGVFTNRVQLSGSSAKLRNSLTFELLHRLQPLHAHQGLKRKKKASDCLFHKTQQLTFCQFAINYF